MSLTKQPVLDPTISKTCCFIMLSCSICEQPSVIYISVRCPQTTWSSSQFSPPNQSFRGRHILLISVIFIVLSMRWNYCISQILDFFRRFIPKYQSPQTILFHSIKSSDCHYFSRGTFFILYYTCTSLP